jgi:drug/metabolite transporter (DMT)-like permease
MLSVLCYAGGVGTLGYFLMYAGLKRVRAASASAVSYLEVVGGVVIGVLVFREPISARMLVGAALIVLATVVVRTADPKR